LSLYWLDGMLVLQPRESRTLRLHTHELTVSPAANASWANDVAGNAAATAIFDGRSIELVIDRIAILPLGDRATSHSLPKWEV